MAGFLMSELSRGPSAWRGLGSPHVSLTKGTPVVLACTLIDLGAQANARAPDNLRATCYADFRLPADSLPLLRSVSIS